MQRMGLAAMLALAAVLLPAQAFARINMVFDVMPGNIINSRDVDGLRTNITWREGGTWYSQNVKHESNIGYIPTMKAGLGIDTEDAYLDFTAGIGGLVNSVVIGHMTMGDMALYYKAGRKFSFGPHMSVVRLEPKYASPYEAGSDDLHIQGGNGCIYGLNFRLGKTVAFVGSLDYLSMEPLILSTPNNTATRTTTVLETPIGNGTKIDVSGWMVQLGVAFRFFTGR